VCTSTLWGQAATYKITTIAGTSGTAGFTGDGGAATSAQLNFPLGLALSGTTLYIADQDNQVVRSVALGPGTISTFAGNNTKGNTGDAAAANKAELNSPTGVTVGSAGVYISDTGNSMIRLVASNGNISTVAGHVNGGAGYSGDAALATGAQFNLPTNVVVDSAGNYYISDTNNNRIRKVGTDGNINTIAGTGTPEYTGDSGPAISAQINHPLGLAIDSAGNVYFADSLNHVIRKITLANGGITTVAGTGTAGFSGDGGPATSAQLSHPEAIAFDGSGNLYIADTFNQRIRVVSSNGTIRTIAGSGVAGFSGDTGLALQAAFSFPRGIAVDPAGNIYVSDNGNHVIRQLSPQAAGGNVPAIGTVVSASDFVMTSTAAQGGWIEIYGSNLSQTKRTWNFGDFSGVAAPKSLDGVSVTVGGQAAAFISYISPGQVNALVSSSTPTGLQPVVVTAPTGVASAYTIAVRGTQPRLAAPPNFNAAGMQYVAAFFQDGTIVLPPVVAGRRRAKAGDVMTLYGIGFGPLQGGFAAGQVVNPVTLAQTTLSAPFRIFFGGVEGTVAYAGIAPLTLSATMYNVGLYQFNVQVPAGVPTGDFVPVTFSLDGVAATESLFTAIGN